MKNIVNSALLSISIFSSAVGAQNFPKKDIENLLIQRFEQLAGGYYVNENCKFISGDEKNTYIGMLSQVNIYAQKLVGREIIIFQQKRGKLGASGGLYKECGDGAKNFFEAARLLTEMFYDDLVVPQET